MQLICMHDSESIFHWCIPNTAGFLATKNVQTMIDEALDNAVLPLQTERTILLASHNPEPPRRSFHLPSFDFLHRICGSIKKDPFGSFGVMVEAGRVELSVRELYIYNFIESWLNSWLNTVEI